MLYIFSILSFKSHHLSNKITSLHYPTSTITRVSFVFASQIKLFLEGQSNHYQTTLLLSTTIITIKYPNSLYHTLHNYFTLKHKKTAFCILNRCSFLYNLYFDYKFIGKPSKLNLSNYILFYNLYVTFRNFCNWQIMLLPFH